MRFVCISDTHTKHSARPIPEGDVLLHAGDFTRRGSLEDVEDFDSFLEALPHKHKIAIAGNHDFAFEREPERARAALKHCVYLQDSEVTVGGVRVYGSPWQPWFMDWAFNLQRGAEIKAKWDLIPSGVHILLTHGPPWGRHDLVVRPAGRGERVGCKDLLEAVARVRPAYHVFGHIHEGYGISSDGRTTFVNASMCDELYNPVNPPLVFDFEP